MSALGTNISKGAQISLISAEATIKRHKTVGILTIEALKWQQQHFIQQLEYLQGIKEVTCSNSATIYGSQ